MPEIKIEINLDEFTFGDLEKLDLAGRGELKPSELVEMLSRIVVGDVRQLPMKAMPDIIEAMNQAMAELTQEMKKPQGEG